jgi:hypothetical protein
VTTAITPSTIVQATNGHISSDLLDETIVLNTETGVYHGLNPVGARVWSLLLKPVRVERICAAITGEFAVAHDDCLRDVLALLQALSEQRLIEVRQDELVLAD